MPGPILSYWQSLGPEEKEAILAGLHGTVLALVLASFRQQGLRLIDVVMNRPGLAILGPIIGYAYYNIVSGIIHRGG